MLVLSRKQHELIRIGHDIVVKVIRTGRNTVKLGILAPSDLRIAREDIPVGDFVMEQVERVCDGPD